MKVRRHCWHYDLVRSNVLFVPPKNPQTCCFCGARRDTLYAPQEKHGRYNPSGDPIPVAVGYTSTGECVERETDQ